MPKKFLLWLADLQTLLSQQKKNLSLQKNQRSDNYDVNLLHESSLTTFNRTKLNNRIKFAKAMLYITAVLFLLVVGINFYFDQTITSLKNDQIALVQSYDAYAETKADLTLLQSQITLYKNTLPSLSSTSMSDYVSLAYRSFVHNITLHALVVDRTHLTILGESTSVLSFTRLIHEYISSSNVSYLVLKSANFNPDTQVYNVDLEVFLK